jgi:hypothetical protein
MHREDGMTQAATGRPVQLAAAAAATAPMVAVFLWMYGGAGSAPDLSTFFMGPLLIGGGMIFWLLFLHLVWCRDDLPSLGFRRPGLVADLVVGVLMGIALLGLKVLSDPWLAGLFPPRPPAPEMLRLIHGIALDPLLLLLWLGPVLWIGVAGFEELWRAVVLRRLACAFPGRVGAIAAVLATSVLMALAHAYQGPAAILSIGFKSLLMGGYFVASGRVRTLIVAHAVYDAVQIVAAVLMIRQSA